MKNASLVTEIEELNRKVREILEQVREKDRQINKLQGNYSKASAPQHHELREHERTNVRTNSCKGDTCSAVPQLRSQMQSTKKCSRTRINLPSYRLRDIR